MAIFDAARTLQASFKQGFSTICMDIGVKFPCFGITATETFSVY